MDDMRKNTLRTTWRIFVITILALVAILVLDFIGGWVGTFFSSPASSVQEMNGMDNPLGGTQVKGDDNVLIGSGQIEGDRNTIIR